jgi:hypothetical protein
MATLDLLLQGARGLRAVDAGREVAQVLLPAGGALVGLAAAAQARARVVGVAAAREGGQVLAPQRLLLLGAGALAGEGEEVAVAEVGCAAARGQRDDLPVAALGAGVVAGVPRGLGLGVEAAQLLAQAGRDRAR